MDEQARIARAFKAFQNAARNKEKDPEGFEAARTRYYFLTKGPAWLDQEKKRIAAEKIEPILADYRDMYTSLDTEAEVQKGYTDSISAIRNKQEDIRDNMGRQTSFLERLLSEESQKKSAFDRMLELTNPSAVPSFPTENVPLIVQYLSKFPSSFTIILDVILALFVLFILYFALSKTSLSIQFIRDAMKPRSVSFSPMRADPPSLRNEWGGLGLRSV
jgi:hypothetical protein